MFDISSIQYYWFVILFEEEIRKKWI